MLKGWVLVLVTFFALTGFAFGLDTDYDGLSDAVEMSLGSSPFHKDIFVEIDWLIVNGRNLKPRPGFVPLVQAVFASAPVLNPDGVNGIRIHIEQSQGIRTTRTVLGSKNPSNGAYNWSEFDAIKNLYFTPSKRTTHHYCLFIADYGDENGQPTNSSGLSRNDPARFGAGASDLIVSLGGPGWYNKPNGGRYKETQAGTFVHELGHNLALKHGGVDHLPFKPNFLSLMNYSFQTDGIPYTRFDGVRFRIYDYERFVLPALNENNLNEAFGLGPFASDSAGVYGTTWWLSKDGGQSFSEKKTYNATSLVDWNQDGRITFVRININRDSKLSTFRGVSQWSKLVYGGGWIGAASLSKASALPSETFLRCLNAKDLPKRTISADDANVRYGSYMDIFKK